MKRPAVGSLDRLRALSDGVYAIVLTLLVLDLHPPESAGGGVLDALAAQWPSFAAYLISFVMIGTLWLRHHRLYRHIERGDGLLLVLNLVHLLFVTLVPFATALVGRFLDDPLSGVLFSASLGLAGLSLVPMQLSGARHAAWLRDGVRPETVAEAWWMRGWEALVAVPAMATSFVAVWLALLVWAVAMCVGVALRIMGTAHPTDHPR